MTCIPINGGFVCMNTKPLLEVTTKSGNRYWMEWHPYAGPVFWHSEDMDSGYYDEWYTDPELVAFSDKNKPKK